MKQKITIVLLILGIAIFGFLIMSKQKNNRPIYSFGGQVTAADQNKLTIRTTIGRQSKEIGVTLDNTEIVQASNQNNEIVYQTVMLSDIKPESLEYFASEVNVYSHTDPASADTITAYRIEVTKEAKATNYKP